MLAQTKMHAIPKSEHHKDPDVEPPPSQSAGRRCTLRTLRGGLWAKGKDQQGFRGCGPDAMVQLHNQGPESICSEVTPNSIRPPTHPSINPSMHHPCTKPFYKAFYMPA